MLCSRMSERVIVIFVLVWGFVSSQPLPEVELTEDVANSTWIRFRAPNGQVYHIVNKTEPLGMDTFDIGMGREGERL